MLVKRDGFSFVAVAARVVEDVDWAWMDPGMPPWPAFTIYKSLA